MYAPSDNEDYLSFALHLAKDTITARLDGETGMDPLLRYALNPSRPISIRLTCALVGAFSFREPLYEEVAYLLSVLSGNTEATESQFPLTFDQGRSRLEVLRGLFSTQYSDYSPYYEYLPYAPSPYEIVYDSGLSGFDTSMRVDVFPFFNETSMLRTRLRVLGSIFDAHLLIEGSTDYRGRSKKSVFLEEFSEDFRISHNIRHLIVDFPPTEDPWVRERLQRDAAVPIIISLPKDALIYSSDLDEIVNPSSFSLIEEATNAAFEGMVSIEQDVYCGSFDGFQTDTRWLHPKAFRGRSVPESLSAARLETELKIVPTAGWHLTYFGDADFVRTKLESFAHSEVEASPENIRNILAPTNAYGRVALIPELYQSD